MIPTRFCLPTSTPSLNMQTKGQRTEESRRYYQKNRTKVLERQRIYRASHLIERRESALKYYRKNRQRYFAQRKKKYKDNINYRLAHLLGVRLRMALTNNQKSGSAVRDLGCTIPELRFYLEGQFQNGMAWENWSTHGWHIDHIIPLALFNLTDREQFLKACHYTNLQPLWAVDNLRKGKKTLLSLGVDSNSSCSLISKPQRAR